MTTAHHTPDPVDVHVGKMIRSRRKMLGFSQHKVAGDLGLTFQQIQKYERGLNRISASKMFVLARALNCAPAYFFQGLEVPGSAAAMPPGYGVLVQLSGEAGGLELAERFLAMTPEQQRALLTIARIVAPGDLAAAHAEAA